ncbi:MAG TPA: ATP-binding protein [Burkholderiales bacterium]|nr:ATP-binding protein [Burkholderiales bacterium]
MEGSEGMILDLLQMTQYTKPIESTVRELATNAADSQTEKQMALSILNGTTKVEDYFVQKEEMESDKYKYSKWNPDYYDPKFLSPNNNVDITYEVNSEESIGYCDNLVIEDYGVGLDAQRLMITVSLGQSTKRLNKKLLGAYGFGAKAALSTDCGYYDIISRHNGKEFRLRCFEKDIEDFTPVRDANFELNPTVTIDDISIRYTPTTKPNGVKIVVPARRVSKEKYIRAIEEQLLYFNNLNFKTLENGVEHPRDIKAKIYYESERIIVSDQYIYDKPHILITSNPKEKGLNMVCYGFLDFDELERPEIHASVGLKCPVYSEILDSETGEKIINKGVSVVPSREAVRQGDYTTRAFISETFNKFVVQEAKEYIEDYISKTTDYLEWLKIMSDLIYNKRNRGEEGQYKVLSAFYKLVDFETLSPIHKQTGLQFKRNLEDLFEGATIVQVSVKSKQSQYSTKFSTYVYKIDLDRKPIDHIKELNLNFPLYYKEGQHDPKKDKFVLSTKNISSFYTITLKEGFKESRELKEILKSPMCLNYADIEVTKDFEIVLQEQEEDTVKEEKAKTLTPDQRRKELNLSLITSFKPNKNYVYWKDNSDMSWGDDTKIEVKEAELKNMQGDVYYMFADEVELMDLVFIFSKERVTDINNGKHKLMYNDEKKFIKVSRETVKSIPNAVHVSQFFNQINDGEFTMDSDMIKWNTARIINDNLDKLLFLCNFGSISEELHTSYRRMKSYCDLHYWENSTSLISKREKYLKNLVEALDKLLEIQELGEIFEGEELEKKVTEKFENEFGITSAKVVDYEVLKELRSLIDFSADLRGMLNNHVKLISKGNILDPSEIRDIKEYIKHIKNIEL